MKCHVCGADLFKKVHLGNYKLSQCFAHDGTGERNGKDFEYTLNQCIKCSHIQLQHLHPSLSENKKEFKVYDLRIKSNEPEHHFNKLAKWIYSIAGPRISNKIIGVSYKDTTLIEYIKRNKNNAAIFFEDEDTLELSFKLQKNSYNQKEHLVDFKYDIIIMRHLLEHIPDPLACVNMLMKSVADDGFLYIELPSPYFMTNKGHAFQIWEEHCSYFTETSLRYLAKKLHLECCISYYENGNEPLLCCLLSRQRNLPKQIEVGGTEPMLELLENNLNKAKDNLQTMVDTFVSKKTYFFGAGHVGIKSINFLGMSSILSGIVDDHPSKSGKISIATGLKVVSREDIFYKDEIRLIHAFRPSQIGRILGSNQYLKSHDIVSIENFFK